MRFVGLGVLVLTACTSSEPTVEPDPAQNWPPWRQPIAHPLDDTLRFHEVQAKSTHNSYHLELAALPTRGAEAIGSELVQQGAQGDPEPC